MKIIYNRVSILCGRPASIYKTDPENIEQYGENQAKNQLFDIKNMKIQQREEINPLIRL